MCDALSASGLTVAPSPLPVAGGNVLVGEDVVLLGADDAARCSAALHGERPESWFPRELDARRRLIVVGSGRATSPEVERPAEQPQGWTEVVHVGNRAPQPLIYMDEIRAQRRVSYFSPYANVLISQAEPARPRVVLPTFGHGNWPELAACDDANADLWEGLGFGVLRLGDCRPLAENLGGPRCLVQVLARSDTEAPRRCPTALT